MPHGRIGGSRGQRGVGGWGKFASATAITPFSALLDDPIVRDYRANQGLGVRHEAFIFGGETLVVKRR
jgi:hypothetical protein